MQAPKLARLFNDRNLSLPAVELFLRCASDRGDSESWSEFLQRYGTKIKQFIRGTLRQDFGSAVDMNGSVLGVHETDLFQNTILRLVDNDCAVMKRFSGTSESELMAYLAVISRCVVRDTMRWHKASKRQAVVEEFGKSEEDPAHHPDPQTGNPGFDRVLVREVLSLACQAIASSYPETSSRDQLVFDLHFSHGLTPRQIAECKGVNLSKGGVEKLLNRVVDRVRALASAGKPEATI
jgi:RNA polymerase sigma factor (sigma-70 family)